MGDKQDLVRKVVRLTGADERSVIKRLAGMRVRGAAGRAIDAALEREGFHGPVESESGRPGDMR
jgi:hypothetical protein